MNEPFEPSITFEEALEIAAERGLDSFDEWCTHVRQTFIEPPPNLRKIEDLATAYRRWMERESLKEPKRET